MYNASLRRAYYTFIISHTVSAKGVLSVQSVSGRLDYQEVEYNICQSLQLLLAKVKQVETYFIKHAADRQGNHETDFEIVVRLINGEEHRILAALKTRVEPRMVRLALSKLQGVISEHRVASPIPCYGILGASYISPESARICSEMGFGYIDIAGNCLLQFGSVYIEVSGRPNRFKDTRGSKSIYERSAVKSSVVLRHLLHEPERRWNLEALAESSSVSVSQASKIKRFLENREYIQTDSNGFHLVQPEAIIREWASTYNGKRSHILDCYSLLPPAKFEKRLAVMADETGVDYCFTGFSAASRYAPATRYNKVHFYVSRLELEAAMEYMELKEVDSGSNVGLMVPYDPCVLLHKQYIKGMHLVSPVQTCLDLWGMRPRGEEAALAIIEKYYRRGTESDVTD